MQTHVAEFLVRGAAVGAFLLLGLGMSQGGRAPARVAATFFCAAAASHTLTQSRVAFDSLGLAAGPVWVLSVMGAGLFWTFAMELFGDSKQLTVARFVPAAALLATGSLAVVSTPGVARWFWLAQNVEGAVLIFHVLFVVWTGWQNEGHARLSGPARDQNFKPRGSVSLLAIVRH